MTYRLRSSGSTFMYLYHLISIDLQLSCSFNTHLQKLTISLLISLPSSSTTANIRSVTIGVIYKELYSLKALILEILIVTPINEIKITIFKPSLININLKLVIIA
jgi:hypothetical protein